MSRDKYLSEIEKRLNRLFIASKEGYKPSSIEKHRFEGFFMHAGVVMGFVTNAELAVLMDDVHIKVFRKTIQQRKEDHPAHFNDEAIDYSGYDQPTFERKDQVLVDLSLHSNLAIF